MQSFSDLSIAPTDVHPLITKLWTTIGVPCLQDGGRVIKGDGPLQCSCGNGLVVIQSASDPGGTICCASIAEALKLRRRLKELAEKTH